MSYATPDEVVSLFRNLNLTLTNVAVTSEEIQEWCDQTDEVINSRLRQVYDLTTPINSTDNPLSFKILKQIESFYVAAIVDDVLNSYEDGQKKPMWYKRAEDLLTMYAPKDCNKCPPTAKLPDVPYVGIPSETGKISVRNITTGPTFRKGVASW